MTSPLHFVVFMPGIVGTKKLILEEEEVVYEVNCCLCNLNTRRPYGELQNVDVCKFLCCTGLSTSLFGGCIVCPGTGCSYGLVNEVVYEMKKRMKDRGDTGQIRRTEEALIKLKSLREEIGEMRNDLRAIMNKLAIERNPSSLVAQMERT